MQTTAASGHRKLAVHEFPDLAPADPTGPRFLIENVYPSVDGGRYPIKRIAGEPVEVWVDLLRDGHDQLAAALLWSRDRMRLALGASDSVQRLRVSGGVLMKKCWIGILVVACLLVSMAELFPWRRRRSPKP